MASSHDSCSRRTFVTAAAAAVLTRRGRATAAAAASKPVRLGGPVFDAPPDPDALARAHRALGYRAAYCPPLKLEDREHIRATARAFASHDVVIAEVGRWCNLLDPDPAKRAANMKTVTDGLALADEVGARCCVDIAGSFNPTVWFGQHPDNITPKFMAAAVENARAIIDAVKPRRARFCYEMMPWALPDSPDSCLAMIKAVDRPAFGVHLDPCNLVNSPERFYRNSELLRECFATLGRWIVSCHAKDVAWGPGYQVCFQEVPLGTGALDYAVYLRLLAALPSDVPLMMEHMKREEYDRSRQHLFALAERIGVTFGSAEP